MNNKISLLEKKIGINFKDKKLLVKSLTHKSFNSNNNYEKLEFLGDRVLGLIISMKLLKMYPKEKEGVLDKKLASLVNKKRCFEVAKSLELEKFILVGNMRNKIHKYENIDLLVTYHPAALLRNPNFKGAAWEDFKFIKKEYLDGK